MFEFNSETCLGYFEDWNYIVKSVSFKSRWNNQLDWGWTEIDF